MSPTPRRRPPRETSAGWNRVALGAVALALVFLAAGPWPLAMARAWMEPALAADLASLPATFHVDASTKQTPSVCVIVRTFFEHKPIALLTLVSSLVTAQQRLGSSSLRFLIVDTDRQQPYTQLRRMAQELNALFGVPGLVSISERTHFATKWLHPGFMDDDFGYVLTDYAMEDLLREGGCDLFLVTNGDNVYSPSYLERVMPNILAGSDVVASHWISRYNVTSKWLRMAAGADCGPGRLGLFQEFFPRFRRQCIDLGAVLFRSALLQRTGLRFLVDELRAHKPKRLWRSKKHECALFSSWSRMVFALWPCCTDLLCANAPARTRGRDSGFFQAMSRFDRKNASGLAVNSTFVSEALYLHQ